MKQLIILIVFVGILLAFFLFSESFKKVFLMNGSDVQNEYIGKQQQDDQVFDKNIDEINQRFQEQVESLPQDLATELASSRLYLMLRNKGGDALRSFVFEDTRIRPGISQSGIDFHYSYSPNGKKIAFISSAEIDETGLSQAQVYVADRADFSGAFPPITPSLRLSESDLPHKQFVTVSDSGKVLVVAGNMEHHEDEMVPRAESASIYSVVNGQLTFVTNGFMPKWISETEFLFLKDDGLYKATEDLTRVIKIAPTQSDMKVLINNRFDISKNGDVIAWIQPQHHQVVIFKRTSEGMYVKAGEVNEKGFWTAISPSGKYIAVQTIDKNATGAEENPQAKIQFFELENFSKIPEAEISLEEFDQLSMFMTEWALK